MTPNFYKDAEIFFTGGSGIFGKAAIEKLLRSCDVKKIYILLRCKKGVSPEKRLEGIKEFNCKPNELDKLVAISGDVELDGLGVSLEHRKMLQNVSIFFHSAATTRFNDPLHTAILVNLKSTYESLKLAESFTKLKMFVYVSTFFSNLYAKHIEDKIYPAVFDWRTAIKMVDSKNENVEPIVIDAITDKLKKGFPNTYQFTKHLAEQVVDDYRHKLPVSIYRPSIVIGAFEEPEPGYVDSLAGIMGLLAVWGPGTMKVFRCNKKVTVNITPLDICTKLLLIFSARAGRLPRERFDNATPVNTCSATEYFPCTLGDMGDCLTKVLHDNPFEKAIWIPGVIFTNSSFVYSTMNFFLELIPAFFIDLLLRLFGQKPFMMGTQRKLYIAINVMNFFSRNQFTSVGVTDYKEILNAEEGTDFDIRAVSRIYRNYGDLVRSIYIISSGCRKFLMNEDECSLPRARKILKFKIFVFNIIRSCLLYLVGFAIYSRVMSYLRG